MIWAKGDHMAYTLLPHRHGKVGENERICEELGALERFSKVSELFKQLSDPTRIRIFWLLCHAEQCVVNLSAMLSMSDPAVSHHLRLLKTSGLIIGRREGKEVYYHVADTEEASLLHKMTERVMEIACPEESAGGSSEKIHAIHDFLIQNLGQRITVEELAKKFYMNPTGLRNAFREVYGDTPSAHLKEHRMKEAARLLRETELSIAEIADRVGYDSQSKFTGAFKDAYHILPRDYRAK